MSLLRHLKAWLRRGRLDDELREELEQHVAWKTDSLIADGVTEDEARRRAAVEVGNVTRLREQSRAVWGFPSFDSIMQDARYGLRQLRRTPLFTLATVATLGLTIGATSASGSGTGSLRKSIASARLKTPALAPMPIASDNTATAVKPGARRIWRKP